MTPNDQDSLQAAAKAGHASRQVIAPHERSYPDPLVISVGDRLTLSGREDQWQGRPEWIFLWCVDQHGKGGWVPAAYIERDGAVGIALHAYDCGELTVSVGEVVATAATVNGWVWCTNQQEESGWVPLTCLQCAG